MRQCMDAENLHRRLKKILGQVQAIDRMIDVFPSEQQQADSRTAVHDAACCYQ